MNGHDDLSTNAGTTKEAERAKKIYRYVSDTARRIDEATPACKTVLDLFSTYMEGMRQKIRDNCEKLMFTDPLAYGRKALELLWRKAYYETISIAKKLREKESAHDNFLFSHIVCGIGHFHTIISRIIVEMDINIMLDYPPMMYDDEEVEKKNVDDDLKQWGAAIIHTCLIYLGDLSRYQTEIFEGYEASIAARYYLQAASLDLSSGMPYNQLGNLYTERNHNLDSVCYYIHCLSCTIPFEGAKGNLTRLFEKNEQYLQSIDLDHLDEAQPTERLKITIARMLSLVDNWFNIKENVDIAELCNITAQDLKVCFAYEEPLLPDIHKNYKEYIETKEAEILYPSYVNPDIIYQIVQICLFCIHKLSENDPSKVFAVKAFTLSLFSRLLEKFLNQLLKYGFKNPSRRRSFVNKENHKTENFKPAVNIDSKFDDSKVNNKIQDEVGEQENTTSNGFLSDQKEIVNGDEKSNGKKMSAKRRRRRRARNSDSSEESDDSEYSSKSEPSKSEGDESSCDDSSYSEDTNDDSDVDIKELEEAAPQTENSQKEKELKYKPVRVENEIPIGLDENSIKHFLLGKNFLPSLKLLQDWVLTETDLILSCGESGDFFFQSVVDVINILQAYFTGKSSDKYRLPSCKILDFAKSASAKLELEFKVIPLPEDVNLRGTDICKLDKDAAEWDLLNKYSPTIYEENIIRILNLVNFGHQISKIVPRVRYNRSMQVFYFKKKFSKQTVKNVRKDTKKKTQRSPPKPSRHGDTLMRSLGRLWLQSQVKELEIAVRGGIRESPPAYLVIDTDALTSHIKLVKQLVKAGKFVILVPTVVLQSIDELKYEVGGARSAIRWLETQLQSGSRFLRTQRSSESKSLPLVKYPRKAPKQVHHFIQIIEFCHHFVSNETQTGSGDTNKKLNTLLVLLTGNKLTESTEEQKDFSYVGLAQSAGVRVDNIVHFFAKWKYLIGKPGNKR